MQRGLSAFAIRSFSLTVLIAFTSLFAYAQNPNQWRALAPLEGGAISSLASAEGRVYALAQGRGLFVSSDNGQSWQTAMRGLEGQTINAVVALDGAVLAAGSLSLYRSTDGGQTWTAVGSNVRLVRVLAHSGSNLIALTGLGQTFLSTDKGLTWTARGNLPSNAFASYLAISGEAIVAGGFAGVWQSSDLGSTWSQARDGLPNSGAPSVFALAAHEDKFYLGTRFYGMLPNFEAQVWVSSDKGKTWSSLGSAFTLAADDIIPPTVNGFAFDGATVFAATDRGIATYDGNNWGELILGRGYPVGLSSQAFTRAGNTLVCGTNGGGIFRWIKDTSNWQAANTGLLAANVNTLAANEQSLFASTGNGTLWRSNDRGQSWSKVNEFKAGALNRPSIVTRLVAKGTQIFAGTESGGAFWSNDNGNTWQALNQGFVLDSPAILDLVVANGNVYCLQGAMLYRFDEIALGWKLLSAEPFVGIRLAVGERAMYAATLGGILRSTDNGNSFQTLAMPEFFLTGLVAARGKQVFIGGFSTASSAINQAYSANEAESYQITAASFYPSAYAFKDELTYATGSGGFYFSSNGLNWTAANAGLTGVFSFNAVVTNGDTVYLGTRGGGVYAATNPHLQIAAAASANAASFSTTALAPAAIATAFGTGLANVTLAATTTPLPTTLGNTRVVVRDSNGVEINAPLFFVSPTQINYQIPANARAGNGSLVVINGTQTVGLGSLPLATVAPGLFAANANGQGPAAAVALRIKADGAQVYESLTERDPATNRFITRTLDLGPENETVFLVAFGTGFRNASGLTSVTAQVGGTDAPVTYAGVSPGLIGVDQANIRLPRSLAGRGEIEVRLTADGKTSNAVTLRIR